VANILRWSGVNGNLPAGLMAAATTSFEPARSVTNCNSYWPVSEGRHSSPVQASRTTNGAQLCRTTPMSTAKSFVALGLTATILAASASAADARWYRHSYHGYYGHPGAGGIVGGAIVGALTIATLPFALLGAATSPAPSPAPPGPARGYYGGIYGPAPYHYAPPPPPGYYPGYGPPPRYYGY
jgi:hypothetical protein